MVPQQPLSASLLFVPIDQRDRILVLRALISEIGSIGGLAHEPDLAQAKLNWWRDALTEGRSHPAIQAYQQLGLWDLPLTDDFLVLIDHIGLMLEESRSETIEQAWNAARMLGGSALLIEAKALGFCGDHELAQAIKNLGAAHYWARQVRDLVIDARMGRWFVPLELQADYQISRVSILESNISSAWSGLVRSLVSTALERLSPAESRLIDEADKSTIHALTMAALDRRLLMALAARPDRMMKLRVLPSHIGNVWVAWRCARGLAAKWGPLSSIPNHRA